jgi:3',5'-cyclic AMP phosphodiesterase CpdA
MSDYVQFGTTDTLAIATVPGSGGDQGVLAFAALAQDETIVVKPDLGLTGTIGAWTLGFDILIPAGQGTWTSFLQTDLANANDGELFIRAANATEGGIGISSVYEGSFDYGAWQRVVFTAERDGTTTTLKKYIDGELVGTQALTGTRWTLDADDGFLILSDNDGDVSGGFLSSFLFVPGALSEAAIEALGAADADGFFAAAPVDGASQFDFADGTYAATFGPADMTAPADEDAPAEPALAIENAVMDVMRTPGSTITIDLAGVFNRDDVTLAIENDDEAVVTAAVIEGDTLTITLGSLGHADLRLTATDAEGNSVADNFRVRSAGENAYTIAVLPDTQDYTDARLGNGPPQTFYNMTQWLVDNEESHNIVFVGHVGDVTQDNLASHWEVANRALSTLDGNIPYSLLPGNHDQALGGTAADHSTEFLDLLFSPDRQAASNPDTFGGVYDRELDRGANNYHTFTAPDGTDWLVLSLEFGPRDDIVRWAGDVIGAHLDHQVILLSHSLTNWAVRHDPAGGPLYDEGAGYDYGMGRDPEGANDGETVYRELLARFPNVAMTFSGHIFGDGAETNVSYSQHGNRIVESLVNYQNGVAREITGNGDAALGGRGGNGAIRLVTVDPDNDRVTTETYFTEFDDYLDGFRVSPERDRDGLTGSYLGHEEVFENWDLSTPDIRAVADAGDDILVAAASGEDEATVTLDAGRTRDPGSVAETYQWRDEAGDVIAEGETAEVALGVGRHALTLAVTDTAGNVTTDAVLVVVTGDRTKLADNFNDGDADGWILPGQDDGLTTGTPESFGLPAIPGGEESVLFLPALPATKAVTLSPNLGAPEGTLVGDYSLVFDILVPDGQGTWTSFIQLNTSNADDGELFIRSNNDGTGGIGISGNYTGSFEYGAWQRVGFVFDDLGNGTTTLAKYIDGELVGTQNLSGDRWKLDVGKGALLFSDESGETSDLYVSSVLVTDTVFTAAEMLALGGVSAGGVLAAAPSPVSVQFDFDDASLDATYGVSTLGFGAIGSGSGNFLVKGTVFARPTAEEGLPAPEARVYDQSDAEDNVLLWGDEAALAWDDYVLALTLRSTDNDGIGAAFRWQDEANHYRVVLDSEANTRSLVKVADGVETVLASETGGTRFNTDQALKIAVEGNGITAFLDGRLLFGGTVTDEDPLGSGTVGLWSDLQRSSQFDTVTVNDTALDAHGGNDQRLLDRDGDGAETVTLSAAGTFGPAAIATYEWRDAEGNLRGTGAETSFDLAVGTHALTLTVTDTAGGVSTDRVDVAVVGQGRIWLDEDFSGEAVPAGWTIVDEGEFGGIGEGGRGSDWRVEDGALTQFSDLASRQLVWNGASNADVWRTGWSPHGDGVNVLRKGTYALYEGEGAEAWENYALETTITTPDNDGLGVLIHYVDENNYYKLELDSEGTYDRSPGNGAGALFTLTRLRDGVEEILGQVPQRYTVGDVFDLRVEIIDQKISAFIDGSEIFAYAIEDRTHEAGTVGLYSWGSAGVAFDDVTVIGLDAVAEPAMLPVLAFLQGGGGSPQGSIATPPAVDPATLGAKLSVTTGDDGTLIENTGLWNDIKAVGFAADDYLPAMGTAFTVANFVDVRLDLSGALDGLDVAVWGAKRGSVAGGDFGDDIAWTAHSNERTWSNTVTIDAGAGDDMVRLASVGGANGAADYLADNASPANGSFWNAGYAGANTLFAVTLGGGEDTLVVSRNAGRVTVSDFGEEDVLHLAGFGANATLAHQGGGVWRVFEGGTAAGQGITLADGGVAVTSLVAGEEYLFV